MKRLSVPIEFQLPLRQFLKKRYAERIWLESAFPTKIRKGWVIFRGKFVGPPKIVKRIRRTFRLLKRKGE